MQKIISFGVSTIPAACLAAQPAPNPTQFNVQIKELLSYAKMDFKNMPPNFKLEGAISGSIQHTKAGTPFYRSLMGSKARAVKAREMVNKLTEKLHAALGAEYTHQSKNATANHTETRFVHNAFCNFEVISVTTTSVANKQNVYLDVYYNQTKKNDMLVHHISIASKEKSAITKRVKKIIIDKLGVDEKEVTDDASLTNDLGADSLDTVELVMEFEKEFDFSIPDEDCECIITVGQVIAYLEAHAKK